MRKLLFALFLLIKLSHEVHDASFVKFCSNVGGALTKSTHEWDSGDECKVIWPIPSSSKLEAKRYCKNWGAYPLKDSGIGENSQTVCTYENVLECRKGYTLINGECYRFVKQDSFVNYKEAAKLCEKEKFKTKDLKPITYKPTIIRFFDKSLIRWFKAYFTNLRSIFVLQDDQLNGIISKDLGGTNFAIVYGMSVHYKSPPNSLVKLPKNAEAQVMCSYKPVDTVLSFGIKAKMIAKYYYPIATKGLVTVWRTSSHSSYLKSTVPEAKLCQASLKAIIGDTQAEVFDPLKENSKSLSAEFRKGFVISRAAVIRCCFPKEKNNYRIVGQVFRGKCKSNYFIRNVVNKEDSSHNCAELPDASSLYYKINTQEYESDTNVETTILFTAGDVDGKYDVVSRKVAVDAPLLCGLYIPQPDRPTEKDCPTAWTGVTRTARSKTVCHRWYKMWQPYNDALEHCKKQGGELSTFTDLREVDIVSLLKQEDRGAWMGFRIKDECRGVTHSSDQSGKCSKRNLWKFTGQFTDDTSQARDFVGGTWGRYEPNNAGGHGENCIELAMPKELNDLPCELKSHTSCMIEAKKEKGTEADCETGWVPYTRKLSSGETLVVCHKMTDIWGNYWHTEYGCKEQYNAVLSTFTTEKEYQILLKLINTKPDQWNGYPFYLGYYKTPDCAWEDFLGKKHVCTPENCFFEYEAGTEITPEVRKLFVSKLKKDRPDGSGPAFIVYKEGIDDENPDKEAYAMCMKKAVKKK